MGQAGWPRVKKLCMRSGVCFKSSKMVSLSLHYRCLKLRLARLKMKVLLFWFEYCCKITVKNEPNDIG